MSLKFNIQVWTCRLVYVLSTCKFHLWLLYTEPQNILLVESNYKYISPFQNIFAEVCIKMLTVGSIHDSFVTDLSCVLFIEIPGK